MKSPPQTATEPKMMKPGNRRRFEQLYEAALNLGMTANHAKFYATEALNKELEIGEWQVAPQSAEGTVNP